MGIRKLKPTTPGQRFMSVSDFAEVTKSKPEKALTRGKKSSGGRNNAGRMTMRYMSQARLTEPWTCRLLKFKI